MPSQEPQDRKSEPNGKNYRGGMRWLGYGIELMGVVGLFGYAGWWLDQRWHHHVPWVMLLGMGIAFSGMIYLLFKETAPWRK